ncbi:MAG TPA: invasin domain 3-containing protein, partial [Gemmatimonadales bacterium]
MASTRSRSPNINRIRGVARRVSIWALVLTLVSCFDFQSPTSAPGALTEATAANSAAATVVLVGAGDIAVCGSSRDEATAALLDNIPGTVFTAGDNAYPDGSATNFSQCYEPSWGRHKTRTRPSPGNHDYHISGAADYFAYYGANAGPAGRGYYSYDIGDWHVVSLNSNVDRTTNSPQLIWLRDDLAASTKQCTVAYWHHARFTSGTQHGNNVSVQPFWQALYDAGAELVIAAHEHNYERFAPQTPAGSADPATGIREFVVGTGGASFYPNFTPLPNSEVRNGATSGVLKLTLDAGTYSWEFIPVAGQTFTDAGSGVCHGPPGGSGVSATQSTVSASPASIASGSATSTITVTAKDGSGNPMSGVTVVLSATGSGNTLTQPAGTTNGSGVATGTLSSTVAGQKTVSATGNGTAIIQTATVTVMAGPLSASQSTVMASPTSIIAGSGSSTITVTAKDGFGNPISGATVILAATGSGNTLTQPSGTTNASGVATGSLGSTVAEAKTVSATINGTAITQTATVTVFPPGSVGTITHALLTSGSAAPNANTYTTASISPAPNALITVAVRNHRTPAVNSPSLSGGGMASWTQVGSVDYDPVTGSLGRVTVFRAMSASPGSGPLTITFVGSVSNVDWIVSQWTGVDQSGTNGSGAIGQIGSARGDAVTTLSVPLAPFANANTVAYGAVGARLNAPAITPGSGFTEIAEVT